MANPDESESSLKDKHDDLCSKLDVDATAANSSWDSFSKLRQNFSLEGDQLHWISCALYVACRTSVTPTVQGGAKLEGNCVSLTKLLRLCNISLIQFFTKIKKWMEMSSMSLDFRNRIGRLERKFAVSSVLFQKFKPIFELLFSGLTNDSTRNTAKATKKHKLVPCTPNALFEFTWCLFICVKGEFHGSADDLVDMYHLLLASLDCIYGNAILALRTDLINPGFPGLPADWNTEHFKVPDEPPCIIATLCKLKEGLPLEASTAKQYSWKPVITSFFTKGMLKGNAKNLTGLLDLVNFDSNLKSLNNLYETYVLSVGEFDERIFLGENSTTDSGNPSTMTKDDLTKAISKFGTSGRSHCPATPLTGRRYLQARSEHLTPVSAATNSIAKLQAYLQGCKPQPSAQLRTLFQECEVSAEVIRTCVIEPCEEWRSKLANQSSSSATLQTHANARAELATALHYKALEQILRREHTRKPNVPLQTLVSQEIFQRSLFACCAEIVLSAYGAHSLRFPWILECLDLSAFHFYKIIELVVQVVMDKLSREVIKHLNAVEEQALESLVWVSLSPIWERINNVAIPPSTDVYTSDTPTKRPINDGMLSPNSSAHERFVLPNADQARKQLFKDSDIKPGQSLLMKQEEFNNGGSQLSESESESPENSEKRNKAGSLVLFFRKFYSLAVVRMNDLCLKLKLNDSELKRKIWTCLEHSIRAQPHLLKDRHLDQLLMCAVYVICKVSHTPESKVERTFTDIMRCYRQQPQADNHVYRSVLIPSDNENDPPERGDLIKFYNKVYVKCMQTFAMRFAQSNRQMDETSLSPLPSGRVRGSPGGPGPQGRCVSERHRLYVSALPSSPLPTPHTQLTYRFSRSPAKDLRAINDMLLAEPRRKRSASQVPLGPPAAGTTAAADQRSRKLQCIISDRQAV